MFNAFIAFITTLLFGVVIFAKIWWDGSGMSFTFTKWYFGIFFIAALVVGACTFAGFIQF
ncbi:hypothetical protein J31TS6_26410 [Brevibacillus reuszeri]|uniref:hypothetical protein n=1 Tax=Brevibacillus reuszeri TaxID=54915 RepID=UPI001B2C57FF|nr:hypothetical protein [Brevibacillus reuszeri]GIO06613.1 hypothetical protein J31TS6_26410 [Brevibacillus reuszeri]